MGFATYIAKFLENLGTRWLIFLVDVCQFVGQNWIMLNNQTNSVPGNNPFETSIDRLGVRAAHVAMMAAVDWCKANGHDARPQIDALVAALKSGVSSAIDQGLADARAAHEAGMTMVIETTFLASMKLCGIRAAQFVFCAA